MFQQRGLHFIHLNINSILPKIDELRMIAFKTNATVIGITESKIDESVLDGEIRKMDTFQSGMIEIDRDEGWFVTLDKISLSTKLKYNVQI